MKAKSLKRVISVFLCVVMLLSCTPLTAFAYDYVSETHQVFSSKLSTIAPGVTSSTNYAYATEDGKQMVYYVATADLNRDDVEVHSTYKNAQCTDYGMDKLTNQMAAAEAKYQQSNPYFKAIAGVNGDFYNMTNGQPSGAFYMDGYAASSKANNRPWFAVFADGTAYCGANNTEWDAAVALHGDVQEAVGGSQMLVVDGKDVTASASGSYNTERHSRSMVGVTADNKVVICTLDGRQEPFSCGGTMHELAQIMLEQGCVIAINLDGGGSSTFVTRPEGEDNFKIINRPSDGSERSISSGLMIATTSAPSNTFDHATLTADTDYVTPSSTVAVSAKGVSPAGTAADVPDDISWALADSSMGTVQDGVFTSNGTVGDAVVQMIYNGEVVGETTIHVVIPQAISFDSETITVPYGKTVDISMTATYGLNEVTMKAGDVDFTLSDNTVGTISGFSLTAGQEGESATASSITAVLTFDSSVTASASVSLGKGSDVVFDFEDGTINDFGLTYGSYNYYLPNHSVSVASAETGKVHSGDHSLALNIDYSNSLESGYQMIALYQMNKDVLAVGAQRLGMWIYVPDDCVSLWARWINSNITSVAEDGTCTIGGLTGQDVDGVNGATGWVYAIEESGWHYLSVDTSAYAGAAMKSGYYCMQFYISDRDGAGFGYYAKNNHNINGNFTFYIDDITVDYSSAVDDREAPVFDSVRWADSSMSDAAIFGGKDTVAETTSNVLSFGAVVHENTTKSNYTGLDESTAKAYIDGVETPCTISGGIIGVSDIKLADGIHSVKFSICDKQGNYSSVIRKINVNSGSDASTIKLVPHDSSLDRIKLGSLYYVDAVATDIEKVDTVTMTLDLDSMSKWELDHMEVADGFKADYTLKAEDNLAFVTIERVGESTATGEAPLVSMPIRTWELSNPVTVNGKTWDYTAFKSSKEFWPIYVDVRVDKGVVTFVDDTTDTFLGAPVIVQTEMWANYTNMNSTDEGKAYFNSWDGGHIHTAQSVEDLAPTCSEGGYTGRTFCEVCNSVVDWGTDVDATGHTYAFIDGKLACSDCGELFNGEFTDGKTYVDGVVIPDGWVGDSYYSNGSMLKGVKAVDGYYYDFGDDGICQGKIKFTGIFSDGEKSYFSKMGVLTSGWQSIADENDNSYFYYFDETTFEMYTGVRDVNGLTYTFDESGKMVRGAFRTNENGTKYFVAGKSQYRRFIELEEGTYWLKEDGYVAYGNAHTVTTNVKDITWYHFDETTGLLTGICDGIIDYEGEKYYCENGKVFYGAVKVDDGIVFSATLGKLIANAKCYIGSSTVQKGCNLETGSYWCDENGYILANGFAEIDGNTYYFDNYAHVKGFTKVGEDYYFFNAGNGKMYKDVTLWVSGSNPYGIPSGYYDFEASGKMRIPDPNGEKKIVEENGKLYFTIDGVKQKNGLNELDGDYYYATSNGALVTGTVAWVSQKNDLITDSNGYYEFAQDGKMVKTGFVTAPDGSVYYYADAVRVKGFTQVGEDYYFFNAGSGKMYKDITLWVSGSNPYGIPSGYYDFEASGKMRIPDPNGEKKIVEENGKLYFTIDGVKQKNGLNELDGDYYYATSNGALVTGTVAWVSQKNDLITDSNGYYEFAEDGKMVKTGFVTAPDGSVYYYADAVRAKGFTQVGEDYYFFNAGSGKMYKDITLWVSGSNAYGVASGYYYFNAEGIME